MSLKVTKQDITAASAEIGLNEAQSAAFWDALEKRVGGNATITLSTVLSYAFGGLTVIALGFFGVKNLEKITALQVASAMIAFALVTLFISHRTYERGSMIQSSIFATMAIAATPLAILTLQIHFDYWPGLGNENLRSPRGTLRDFHAFIDSRWLVIELGTLAVAAMIFAAHRTHYILMPITVIFWWMVMDFSMYQQEVARKATEAANDYRSYDSYKLIYEWNSVYFGLAAIAVGAAIDWMKKTRVDMAYWVYIAGVVSFWGGLIMMGESGHWAAFKFFLVNVVLFLIGGVFVRGVFLVAGGFGMVMYIFRLVDKQFRDDPLFALYLAGIGFVGLVLVYVLRPYFEALMAQIRAQLPNAQQAGQAT